MPDQHLNGWLVAVLGPNDRQPRLYAVVAERVTYPSLADEAGHAEGLVGDRLLVTNELVEFQQRLTDGEVARLGLKVGEVKRFA